MGSPRILRSSSFSQSFAPSLASPSIPHTHTHSLSGTISRVVLNPSSGSWIWEGLKWRQKTRKYRRVRERWRQQTCLGSRMGDGTRGAAALFRLLECICPILSAAVFNLCLGASQHMSESKWADSIFFSLVDVAAAHTWENTRKPIPPQPHPLYCEPPSALSRRDIGSMERDSGARADTTWEPSLKV